MESEIRDAIEKINRANPGLKLLYEGFLQPMLVLRSQESGARIQNRGSIGAALSSA